MAQDLLLELHSRGIKLRVADSRLDVLAPPGALTPELRETLRARRDELIAMLRRARPDADRPEFTPRPDQRYEPFPLTDIQHAYWVGRNPAVELGGVSTHMYLELERTGLDLGRLTTSLRRVVDRHDMLRAIIHPDGRQQILREVPAYDIAVRDLRDVDEAARDAALEEVRAEMGHQVLPADRWPLFDIRASRLPGDRLRLHVGFDMLIMDGFSCDLVFREWRRFYEEPGWTPAPLSLSYRDHVIAEEAARQSGAYRRAEEYWLGRVEELPLPPELPLAASPARVGGTEFVRRNARLPRGRWETIKNVAARRGLTPSAVLMAAYAEVLRQWAGQADLTLNLTLFNRPQIHPEIDRIVGDFTSVTLLAAEAAPDESFGVRAERLQRRLLADMEHQAYNGVRVLRARARGLGGRPGAVMPIVFTSLLGVAAGPESGGGGDGRAWGDARFFGDLVHSISQTPQVWLDHQVSEDDGDLVLNWDALEALFPPGLLDDMFACYRGLFDRLSRDETAWDGKETLLPPPSWQLEERARANDTAAGLPERTLGGLVEERAVRCPDTVAVIAADGRLTYEELLTRSRRLAHRLVAAGAPAVSLAGSLVGVVMEKGRDQVAAVLGVSLSGAAYLPLDPGWPEARRNGLLERCRSTTVVTTPRLRDELTWPGGVRVLTFEDAEVAEADAGPLEVSPTPEDLAYVIFTSGSTGTPKGVMIDHRGAANTVQDVNARFEVGPGDRVLALSLLSFDLSVYDVFGILAAGGTVVLPSPVRLHDPAHWTDLVRRHEVTIWNSVPALMQAWVDHVRQAGAPEAGTLRLALVSGDWIPVALPGAIRAAAPHTTVISLGGATEASIWSVMYPIGEVPAHWTRIPYGKPLANQTLHVYDDRLEPCPVWTTGEIYIGGDGVALGYWGDDERTTERFVVHPLTGERLYRTGDQGRYLPGGDIEFLGRQDFQVKINGYRIELEEIAAALRRRPEVGEALVTVVTHPSTGRRQLAAYVVPAGEAAPEPAALRDGLESLLPEYMVPNHYVAIDRVPVSANGKVDPSALPAPWDTASPEERAGPRDPLEEALHGIWCEALERDDFGIEENFFELGGDSLHAVRILGRIRETLGVMDEGEEGLQRLFDNPTVASLATSLRDRVAT